MQSSDYTYLNSWPDKTQSWQTLSSPNNLLSLASTQTLRKRVFIRPPLSPSICIFSSLSFFPLLQIRAAKNLLAISSIPPGPLNFILYQKIRLDFFMSHWIRMGHKADPKKRKSRNIKKLESNLGIKNYGQKTGLGCNTDKGSRKAKKTRNVRRSRKSHTESSPPRRRKFFT